MEFITDRSTIDAESYFKAITFFFQLCFTASRLVEPRHDKTNKVTVRPAKTQISLGFTVHLMGS